MRQKRVELELSEEEQTWLQKAFPGFLDAVQSRGADAGELEVLSAILNTADESKTESADPVRQALHSRVRDLLRQVLPDQLTLAEAAAQYGVKADRLRRACWSGKLRAEKRGKTWFVNTSVLEQFLHAHGVR